jgi:hypothetical protein
MSEDDASGAASADTPTIYSTTAYSDDLKEFQCELDVKFLNSIYKESTINHEEI